MEGYLIGGINLFTILMMLQLSTMLRFWGRPSFVLLFILELHYALAYVYNLNVRLFYDSYDFTGHFYPVLSVELYLFVLCFGLVFMLLNQLAKILYRGRNVVGTIPTKQIGFFNISVWLPVVLLSYYFACRFNTLGVGLDIVELPFRLSGIIEALSLYILPVYITLMLRNKNFLAFVIILSFSGANLLFFGSKFSALSPVVCYGLTSVSISGSFRYLLVPSILTLLVVVGTYTMINPYVFRVMLNKGEAASVSTFSESYNSAASTKEGGGHQFTMGLFNLSNRLIGVTPLQWSIGIAKSETSINLNPNRFLNKNFLKSRSGHSEATGHNGYFVILFSNVYLGFILSALTFLLIFLIFFFFEKSFSESNKIIVMTTIVSLLPLFLDGRYYDIGIHLKILFMVVILKMIFWTNRIRLA